MKKSQYWPRLFCVAALAFAAVAAGCKDKDTSMKMNSPRNIHGVRGFQRTFPDKNDTHLVAAQALGIQPLASREEAEELDDRLVRIEDNDLFIVDSLTHSIPYLVPQAHALLDEIGANFLDSLASKGLNPNQIIVTSVLRTTHDVKRLRRGNGNATENSCTNYILAERTASKRTSRESSGHTHKARKPNKCPSNNTCQILYYCHIYTAQSGYIFITAYSKHITAKICLAENK